MNRETGPPEILFCFFLAIVFGKISVLTIRITARMPIPNYLFIARSLVRRNNPAMYSPVKALTLLAVACGLVSQGWAETSRLWGTNGELWTASSRLPDFSYAGYHCGEAPLPVLPPGPSVKDFGAR